MKRVWTKPIVERFEQLLADPAGYSYDIVARKLSLEFAVSITRSAAIGFAKRHNVPKRDKSKSPRKADKWRKPAKEKQPALPTEPYVPRTIGVGTLHIEQLTQRSCRWPFGDRSPFLFCGCTAVEGHPYCESHMKLGHVRWQPSPAA